MLLAGALVAGCAIGVAGTLAMVSSSTHSNQLASGASSKSKPYWFAKNSAEIRLFKASEKSCGLISAKGMRVKLKDGGEERYFKVDYTGGRIEAVQLVDAKGKSTVTQIMPDEPPFVCWPAMLAQQFERGAPSTATAYLIDALGRQPISNDETFVLHMHTQSATVSNLYLQVKDGVITGYSGPDAGSTVWVTPGDLTYDLTQAERDAIQAAVANN